MSELMQAPPESGLDGLEASGESGRNSRLIALLAIGAGLVVLGLAAFFLFFSGGGDEVAGTVPGAQPSAPVDPGNDKAGKKDKKPPKFDSSVGRNPFQPLAIEEIVVEPTPEAAPTGATGGTTGTDGGSAPAAAPDYYLVVYRGASGGTASIVVNGVTYDVGPGDLFPDRAAGPFKLERVTDGGKQAVIRFGSETYEVPKNKVLTIKL